jgi:hypothetical protein
MEPLIQRRELTHLLRRLDNPELRGIAILGSPGIGKTVLLRQLGEELRQQGRPSFLVYLHNVPNGADLVASILSEIAVPFDEDEDIERVIRVSSGDLPFRQAAETLNRLANNMQSPVLLLDGLDESPDRFRMTRVIEELSHVLSNWKLVVSSRDTWRFRQFDVLELGPLTQEDAVKLVRSIAPNLSDDVVQALAKLAKGNPLVTYLVANYPQDFSVTPNTLEDLMPGLVRGYIDSFVSPLSQASVLAEGLLAELALAGGKEYVSALATKLLVQEDQIWEMVTRATATSLLRIDRQAGTVAFVHSLFQELVFSQWVFDRQFRLADLRFGSEEAERDDLLDASFVRRANVDQILGQRRSIIIGDRGSGKSAIFRKLMQTQPTEIVPFINAGDLLHRIVDHSSWLEADAVRAAWLSAIAAMTTSTVFESAPKEFRRGATNLRAALGLPIERPGQIRRTLRAASRMLGGTTLKFGVGPVNFEASLPIGPRSSGSFLDVDVLLQEIDEMLKRTGRHVTILCDRIDETFKYDRNKQQTMVQSLLQAESRISQLEHIELVVFLRTDLFELYDIQEKNKLVSRTLTLAWSEEDWLQVLVRRIFANEPLARLARRLRVDGEGIQTRAALEVLFPSEIEGQSIDSWLVDSLRNGNGDISPRLAVLLLHLARDQSPRPDDLITAVPLFSAEAVQRAMTKLSDLSFSEIVNDFKVASTFVLNCRAGKIMSFTLAEVEDLFEGTEGEISDQVRLLERLGFLERVVEQHGAETRSLFRIPRLYARSFDYA